MADTAVAMDNVGFAYRHGRWVLRGATCTLRRGGVTAILGPNGRGKSTLVKLLLGLLKPQEGSVSINGRVAYVPQLFDVAFDYTVLDIVLMGRARRIGLFSQPSAADEAAARSALQRFGIANLVDRGFHELSGGERQLTLFARALVAEADVLILDEPTSALDLKNQVLILDWIVRLVHTDGMTVVFTTHHPHHALAVADDALLMLGPAQLIHGSADAVLTELNLQTLYGVEIRRLHFEHGGRRHDTFALVLGVEAKDR